MKQINLPDAVERYVAGETAKGIAKSHGVSDTPVIRQLRDAGVYEGNSGGKRRRFGTPSFDEAIVVDRYLGGESEKAVAGSIGCSRALIRNVLLKHDVPVRGRSDAMFLRMAKASPEERLALTEAAHAMVRGVPHSEEMRLKMAKGREHNGLYWASPLENILAANLRAFGIEVAPQKAEGRYNIDLALAGSSVAVEVFGGHWHGSGDHARRHRQRFDYLVDRGWLPIIVWATDQFPLDWPAVEYIVSWHERRRRGEPGGREEHVIRGDGKGGPISEGQPNSVPRIPCPEAGDYARGHDRCAR